MNWYRHWLSWVYSTHSPRLRHIHRGRLWYRIETLTHLLLQSSCRLVSPHFCGDHAHVIWNSESIRVCHKKWCQKFCVLGIFYEAIRDRPSHWLRLCEHSRRHTLRIGLHLDRSRLRLHGICSSTIQPSPWPIWCIGEWGSVYQIPSTALSLPARLNDPRAVGSQWWATIRTGSISL